MKQFIKVYTQVKTNKQTITYVCEIKSVVFTSFVVCFG